MSTGVHEEVDTPNSILAAPVEYYAMDPRVVPVEYYAMDPRVVLDDYHAMGYGVVLDDYHAMGYGVVLDDYHGANRRVFDKDRGMKSNWVSADYYDVWKATR